MHTTLKNSSSIADVQPNSKNMVRFGVIGYGYWGPNVVRNLTSLEGSELMSVCDKSPAARRRMQKSHPGIAVATEASEILASADINAIWDLAPHDLSIMDYLIRQTPEAIVATGQTHLNGFEDVAFMTLYFPDKVIAHINVNWLSPVKVRTTLIGGEKKMLVWNDLEADEKVKVYDKGVSITSREGLYNLLVNYRSGDMWAPQLEQVEALRQELSYFVDCISNDQTPMNDGNAGLRVVKMLEAANESLRHRGALVYL